MCDKSSPERLESRVATRKDDTTLELQDIFTDPPCGREILEPVLQAYPFLATRYYLSLIRTPGDPIWRQVIPDPAEIQEQGGFVDPLDEENRSPVINLVHRYPNRILWLVSDSCAVHCRFCTRKRRWKERHPLSAETAAAALGYIRSHEEIRDVLLSGGDPLTLSCDQLDEILTQLRKIPHVQIIRLGTRIPCTLPMRVDCDLVTMLKRHHPLFVNVHFNHPRELTPEARAACTLLADAGIPLGSQTVLLRGINDQPEILAELFQTLLTLRVRPYYLMQMDLTASTAHFRTPISTGLAILQSLRNHISGLAVPQYVVDLPGGHGKIPLLPNSIMRIGPDTLTVRNYQGRECSYPLLPGEDQELMAWLGKKNVLNQQPPRELS
jgi:lysine 2,3-aminomutase